MTENQDNNPTDGRSNSQGAFQVEVRANIGHPLLGISDKQRQFLLGKAREMNAVYEKDVKDGKTWDANWYRSERAAWKDLEHRLEQPFDASTSDTTGEATKRFHIEWIAAARPPVHPNAMTGRATFDTFDEALDHMRNQAEDAVFVSLVERTTIVNEVDFSSDMRLKLGIPSVSE